MTVNICSDPDLLKILLIINNLITIVKICLPLIIIVIATVDVGKTSLNADQGEFKKSIQKCGRRLVSAIIIFFIPTIVDVMIGFADDSVDFLACFSNANYEYVTEVSIRRVEESLLKAEGSLLQSDYDLANAYVYELFESSAKENYINRLKALKQTMNDSQKPAQKAVPKNTKKGTTPTTGSGNLEVVGSYSSNGDAKAQAGVKLSKEPDPSAAINYWAEQGKIDASKFVYPKDEATGLPLGAWPENYKSIPTQLTNYKTYQNDTLIFPTTPTNGEYHFVYSHVGMDIMAPIGTPIYSPVDGKMYYSEWGQTVNTGGDETAYTVSIKLDKPFTYAGVNVNTVFLTHMSGIRYRCPEGKCTRRVQKGELLGFVGNASGSATSIGYAPHLHITYYPVTKYKTGLKTEKVEELYGIPVKTSSYGIKAGE